MFRVTLIIALLTGAAGLASAAPRVLGDVEGSYELMFKNVRMPLNASDSVTLRTCDTCDTKRHSVNANTRYLVGQTALPLPDFLAVTQDMRATSSAGENVLVLVFYDLTTTHVTRIVVLDHRE